MLRWNYKKNGKFNVKIEDNECTVLQNYDGTAICYIDRPGKPTLWVNSRVGHYKNVGVAKAKVIRVLDEL